MRVSDYVIRGSLPPMPVDEVDEDEDDERDYEDAYDHAEQLAEARLSEYGSRA